MARQRIEHPARGCVRHSLAKNDCDHVTCAVGDLFGDGRLHLVTGTFSLTKSPRPRDGLSLWKVLGPDRPAAPK